MAVCVGRDAELKEIGGCLARSSPVLVVGEAGIGKSTVAVHAARVACLPLTTVAGFRSLTWRRFGPFLPLLGGVDREDGPDPVVAAALAAAEGGALLVDDLQWVDAGTLQVVVGLSGLLPVLAVVREEDPGAASALVVLREAGFDTIALRGLDDEAAAEVVRGIRGDLSRRRVAEIVNGAGGNPLFLEELARGQGAAPGLPAALRSRIDRLGDAARHALVLVALAGRPVRVGETGELPAELVAENVVTAAGDTVTLRHALVGEAAIDLLDPAELAAAHDELAGLLEDGGEVARHLAAAGRKADARELALHAAEAADRRGDAASLLALAAVCADGPEADELRLRAAGALREAGDYPGVRELIDVVAGTSPETRARSALLRADACWETGLGDEARRAVADGLAEVAGSGTPLEVRLRIEEARLVQLAALDLFRARRLAEEALELAREVGVEEARAGAALGYTCLMTMDPRWETLLPEALERARREADVDVELQALEGLVYGDLSRGNLDRAAERNREAVAICSELGFPDRERIFLAQRLWVDIFAGDYPEVLRGGEALLADSRNVRNRELILLTHCTALVDTGREQEALDLAREALNRTEDMFGRETAYAVLAEAEFWAGRPARAVDVIDEAFPEGLPLSPMAVLVAPVRAWAGLELGKDLAWAPGSMAAVALFPALAEELEAVGMLHKGQARRAADGFAAAADQWAGLLLRNELRCRWAQGEALRRAPDLVAARGILQEVASRARRHGMEPLLSRVRRSLRLAGGEARGRTSQSAGILSEREQAVVELVGMGLANAEVARRLGVARSTVARQLESARSKLGARSRIEAAVLAGADVRVPLSVFHGDEDGFLSAQATYRARGWELHAGWEAPASGTGVVRFGRVVDRTDAADAVLAAVAGEGVLALVDGHGELADAFIQDLRRVGSVGHHSDAADGATASLDPEDRRLLRRLAGGHSTRQAAAKLCLTPRAVRYRLAGIRARLGVSSNAEAVIATVGGSRSS